MHKSIDFLLNGNCRLHSKQHKKSINISLQYGNCSLFMHGTSFSGKLSLSSVLID